MHLDWQRLVKNLRSTQNFRKKLNSIDASEVPLSSLISLASMMNQPEFSKESLKSLAPGAEKLGLWAMKVYDHAASVPIFDTKVLQ